MWDFSTRWKRRHSRPETLSHYVSQDTYCPHTQQQFRRLNSQKQHDCWAVWNTRALFHKTDKEKWVTGRDGEGQRLALMSMFSGQVKGNNEKTGDRDRSHLWSVVINWPWSPLCPVILSWCRRWKGSAIYQHLRVNLSRPQRLGAGGAGADYQGTTPTARIFIST